MILPHALLGAAWPPRPLTRACMLSQNVITKAVMVYAPKCLNPPYLLRLCEQHTHNVSFGDGGSWSHLQRPAHVARNALFGMGGMEGTLGLT